LLSNKDICDIKYVDEVLVQLKINILYQIMFYIYWYKLIEILRKTVMTNFIKNLTSGTLKILKS